VSAVRFEALSVISICEFDGIWLVNDQDQASNQKFSLGGKGSDPEVIYHLFYFKNYIIKIM
jgi:hypothetical protein